MKKLSAIAMLGFVVCVSACGPKAQNAGTTVAPPAAGTDPAAGGAAPAGGTTGTAPNMNANPGSAPAAP